MDNNFMIQYTDLQEALQHHGTHLADKLYRLQAELSFAKQMCGAHTEQSATWSALILEAGQLVDSGLRKPGGDVDVLIHEAEAVLTPLAATAKTYQLLCVGHAHIDMNWQWSWPETVGLTHDTFQTMLVLMEQFPDFIFSQSQASVYALIEKYNPEMFQRIRQRVKEGRWEVTASQWVEGDKNLASGESISRHLLYTRAYFQEKFALSPEDVQIDFEPDTFGHPASLPTILAQGGVRYYYHCRGSRGPHLYWWVGADGSRILTFNDIQWYMHHDAGYRHIAIDASIADPLIAYSLETGLRTMPVLYGVGDHGGGPTRRDLRRILDMQKWPIYPTVRFSTLQHYFKCAEQANLALPEITGERNFVFAGCYTSQARQKQANRQGENILYGAEAAATIGDCILAVPYPYKNLEAAWQQLLFDQFHDILPGSGIQATRHYTLGHAQDVQAAAMMARTNALRALSRHVDTQSLRKDFVKSGFVRARKDELESGLSMGAGVGNATGAGGESAFSVAQTSDRAYFIFNTLPHNRSEVVRVKVWDTSLAPQDLVVSSEGSRVVQTQIMGQGQYAGHHYMEIAFPVSCPALGYQTVCISDRRAELGLPEPAQESQWEGEGGSLRTRQLDDAMLENEFLKVRLDAASGSITSLVDKRTGREWISPDQPSGILQYCLEAYEGMSAWVIGQFIDRHDVLSGGKLQRIHKGPYIQTYRWTRSLEKATKLELDITLISGEAQLQFNLKVDWRQIGSPDTGIPHLKVRFPLHIENARATYEIPFGSLQRDLTHGEEVPAQRWVDFSEADGQGMTLVNNSKYGFNVEGNSLNMTLLRGSIDPDPLPDLGVHIISYALVVHESGWTAGDCMEAGEDWNVPVDVVSTDFHEGILPAYQSLLRVEPHNIRVTAIKKAQDGKAIILRLVEVEGQAVTAHLTLSSNLVDGEGTAKRTDTMERIMPLPSLPMKAGKLSVLVEPYSIVTLRLENASHP